MVGAPHFLSRTTLRPLGPNVTFTASARLFKPRSSPRRASSAKAIILAMRAVLPLVQFWVLPVAPATDGTQIGAFLSRSYSKYLANQRRDYHSHAESAKYFLALSHRECKRGPALTTGCYSSPRQSSTMMPSPGAGSSTMSLIPKTLAICSAVDSKSGSVYLTAELARVPPPWKLPAVTAENPSASSRSDAMAARPEIWVALSTSTVTSRLTGKASSSSSSPSAPLSSSPSSVAPSSAAPSSSAPSSSAPASSAPSSSDPASSAPSSGDSSSAGAVGLGSSSPNSASETSVSFCESQKTTPKEMSGTINSTTIHGATLRAVERCARWTPSGPPAAAAMSNSSSG